MGKLLLIIADTPFHSERIELSLEIVKTALKKGHKVTVFLFMDGVYNALISQRGEIFKVESVNVTLTRLVESGAKIIVCKFCSELRGVNGELIAQGTEALGIAELDDELVDADAVLSFMGEG